MLGPYTEVVDTEVQGAIGRVHKQRAAAARVQGLRDHIARLEEERAMEELQSPLDGNELMAMTFRRKDGRIGPSTWHVVQHEGFHQFCKAVIRGDVNEQVVLVPPGWPSGT